MYPNGAKEMFYLNVHLKSKGKISYDRPKAIANVFIYSITELFLSPCACVSDAMTVENTDDTTAPQK